MRILVTGSRDWSDKDVIREAIEKRVNGVKDVTLVNGDATGADRIAAVIARNMGCTIEDHPANWESCGEECGPDHWRYRDGKPYCPRAGFVRNTHMVELGADICLAFIRNNSKGATMTAKLAERAGIPVHRYIQNDET